MIRNVEIAVIGAGVAGIATAYYLGTKFRKKSILLIDSRQPMSFTSAQSGDNYRNWWPHPVMADFSNYSIDLMERIALESSNVLNMTRRGYALATRSTDIGELIAELHAGYGDTKNDLIRVHNGASSKSYQPPLSADWPEAPYGVDILSNQKLIRQTFSSFSKEIANVLHIRRGGDISGQQMGQYMLERIKEAGGKRLCAELVRVEHNQMFTLDVQGAAADEIEQVNAEILVNAAGPFVKEVAAMIDIDLPIDNVFQQKLLFEDSYNAIPRQLPFSIDLDEQELSWTDEERQLLAEDPDMAWLTRPIPGGVHCRPDGGDKGAWVKLGWAYNRETSQPLQDVMSQSDPHYPEIVMRGAANLNPSLKRYVDSFPGRWTHYGGYYTMTHENWPLIGPLAIENAYVVGALSGFGSMAACAAGAICSAWIAGGELPYYARQLSPQRYGDQQLMARITQATNKGVL